MKFASNDEVLVTSIGKILLSMTPRQSIGPHFFKIVMLYIILSSHSNLTRLTWQCHWPLDQPLLKKN
jgi:hypothetical protein